MNSSQDLPIQLQHSAQKKAKYNKRRRDIMTVSTKLNKIKDDLWSTVNDYNSELKQLQNEIEQSECCLKECNTLLEDKNVANMLLDKKVNDWEKKILNLDNMPLIQSYDMEANMKTEMFQNLEVQYDDNQLTRDIGEQEIEYQELECEKEHIKKLLENNVKEYDQHNKACTFDKLDKVFQNAFKDKDILCEKLQKLIQSMS